jgi:hypothetical protein
MRRHWMYLKSVLRHKWYVFLACLQFRVPLWSAVLHDWDKFLPDEWLPYARTFYKLDGTSQYVESIDFAQAWMKHQHRNKHHWQYWVKVSAVNIWDYTRNLDVLIWDRGEAQVVVERNSGAVEWLELRDIGQIYTAVKFVPDRMPDSARREMLADWFGAGRAYNKDWTPLEPRKWYEENKNKMKLHDETRSWIENELLKREEEYLRFQKLRGLGML